MSFGALNLTLSTQQVLYLSELHSVTLCHLMECVSVGVPELHGSMQQLMIAELERKENSGLIWNLKEIFQQYSKENE